MMLHNSHDPFYRVPAGPVPCGTSVLFRFRCDEAQSVTLRTWMEHEHTYPMSATEEGDVWEVSLEAPAKAGQFWYDFTIVLKNGSTVRYGNAEDQLGGEGQVITSGPLPSYLLTVYSKSYRTPAWMHGASIYQIFPDRFCKAPSASVDCRTDRPMHADWNEPVLYEKDSPDGSYQALDCYGGTLNGIRRKLPYLHDLGVTVLYLNPVFQARSNHRYDTGDYKRVDPLLGTNEELTALFREAEALDMHVMLDGVFSHTGADSRYFNQLGHYEDIGACQSEDSPYFGWYTFKRYPDLYRSWWGFPSLPECRKDNASYQDFMFHEGTGVVPWWILQGSSGWRLDVADELSLDFLRKLRRAAKKADRNAVVLGEVWEDASNKEAYGEIRCYCCGDTLDSVMNYPLRSAILDFVSGKSTAYDLVRLIRHQEEVYPAPFRYSLMNLLGSHDRPRVLNALVGREGTNVDRAQQARIHLTHYEYALAVKRYKLCLDILCALPGCPTIYYGDEAGMTGCSDPFCRGTYPWGKEDRELQSYVREKLNHHQASDVLRLGFCEVEAMDDDTLRIRRYLKGKQDALGSRTGVTGQETALIKRT